MDQVLKPRLIKLAQHARCQWHAFQRHSLAARSTSTGEPASTVSNAILSSCLSSTFRISGCEA